MVRDFTKEAYDELLAQVDSINNVPFQEELINRVSGTPVLSNLFAGQFGGAFNEIKEYQELFFNRLHLNKSNIDRIFQDVNTVNYDYKHLYDEYKNDVLTHIRLISNLSDSFGQPNDTAFYLSVVALKSTFEKIEADYIDNIIDELSSGRKTSLSDDEKALMELYYERNLSALLDKYPGSMPILEINTNDREMEARLVGVFRLMNPEIAKDIDDFFGSAVYNSTPSYQFENDILNITFISMTADEPYRSLFFDVLDEVQIGVIDQYERDLSDPSIILRNNNGVVPLRSRFIPGTNVINFNNLGADSCFIESERGAYSVFYHEMGHAIDYHVFGYSFYSNYFDRELYNNIRYDVEACIKNEVINVCASYGIIAGVEENDKIIRDITDALMSIDNRDIIINDPKLGPILDRVYRNFCGELKNAYGLPPSPQDYFSNNVGMLSCTSTVQLDFNGDGVKYSSQISDIFDGSTNGYVQGYSGHYISDSQYWIDSNGPTGALERETAAHYFSLMMTRNDEAYELWESMVPNVLTEYSTMYDQMAFDKGLIQNE